MRKYVQAGSEQFRETQVYRLKQEYSAVFVKRIHDHPGKGIQTALFTNKTPNSWRKSTDPDFCVKLRTGMYNLCTFQHAHCVKRTI